MTTPNPARVDNARIRAEAATLRSRVGTGSLGSAILWLAVHGCTSASVPPHPADTGVCDVCGDASTTDHTAMDLPVDMAPSDAPADSSSDATPEAADVVTSDDVTDVGRDVPDDTPRVGPIPFVAGTRLRPVVRTGGGTRLLVGWYDSARRERCRFDVARDGRTRCIALDPLHANGDVFLDAACTRPGVSVVVDPCAAEAPSPGIVRVDAGCGRTSIYQVGARELIAPPTYYYRATDGTCTASTATSTRLYERGAEVPPSAFVAARTERETTAGALVGTYYVADDGAQQRAGWYDTALDTDCQFLAATDGTLRCVPGSAAQHFSDQFFGDMLCSTRVFVYASACLGASPPRFVTSTNPCDFTARALGEAVSPSMLRVGSPAYCVAPTSAALPPDPVAFPIGAIVPPSTMPLMRSVREGSGRLRLVMERGDSGTDRTTQWSGDALYFDSVLDVECSFRTDPNDGRLRCMPSLASSVYYDAACTMLAARRTNSGCGRVESFGVSVDRTTTCAPRERIFRLGAALTSVTQLYYRASDGRCLRGPSGGTYSLSALDAEIAIEMFASATDAIE